MEILSRKFSPGELQTGRLYHGESRFLGEFSSQNFIRKERERAVSYTI